jgi:hypothetical protein
MRLCSSTRLLSDFFPWDKRYRASVNFSGPAVNFSNQGIVEGRGVFWLQRGNQRVDELDPIWHRQRNRGLQYRFEFCAHGTLLLFSIVARCI